MNKLILFFILVGFAACNIGGIETDLENPKYKPEVLLPLGTASYTITQLIEDLDDTTLTIKEDNKLVILYYYDTIQYDDIDKLVKIEDQSHPQDVRPNINVSNPVSTVEVPFETTLEYEYESTDGEIIDSVYFSDGIVSISIQSSFDVDAEYSLSLRNLVQKTNREPLVFSGTIPSNGTSATLQESLSNYIGIFEWSGTLNIFSVDANFNFTIDPGETVTDSDFFTVTIDFFDQRFSAVFGQFGQDTLELSNDTLDIDFFKDMESFGLEFGNPAINLYTTNSFGTQIGLDFSNVGVINQEDEVIALDGSLVTQLQSIAGPSLLQVGKSIEDQLTINKNNSNLVNLLAESPKQFTYQVNGIINPEGETQNFITDSSQFEGVLEIELPLEVKLDSFERAFEFDLGSGLDFDDADSIFIRIITVNELPFSGRFDVHFITGTDTTFSVKDSVILNSAPVGLNGKTEFAFEEKTDLRLDQTGIAALNSAEKIALILKIDSYEANEGTFVKIFSDYKLEIGVSVKGHLNVEL